MTVNAPFNAPFGHSCCYDGYHQQFLSSQDDQRSPEKPRPFFVPHGYMRIGLEEGRVRCCPPGLYELDPHEMFQAVAMKFCPPGASDAVIDLPIGDFTQTVVMRHPTWDIYELYLIVQARISKMKKFALANSSNPGTVVYMILRDEIFHQLQASRSPYQIGSKSALDAINQKTGEIGLEIRCIFVDNVVYDRRRNAVAGNASPVAETRTESTTDSSSHTQQVCTPELHCDDVHEAGEVLANQHGDGDDDDRDSQYTIIQQLGSGTK